MTGRRLSPVAGANPIVRITPEDAGWQWIGLTVLGLDPGQPVSVHTGGSEIFVVPLAGSLRVEVSTGPDVRPDAGQAGTVFGLTGRASVFTRVSDFAYVGRDSILTMASDRGAEVALPAARCTRRRPPAYGAADAGFIEVRGAGHATRQVTNFGVPGVWDHAEKLICCEVLTPSGNWSSYPPHKHDASQPCPVVNEEIYLYRVAGLDQITPDRAGMAYHRTYTTVEHAASGLAVIDDLFEVRDLDSVLVPHGYHGPSIAAPGYPLYYLNVMAGPATDRQMAFCDDPQHTWIRAAWDGQQHDPRCPMTSLTEHTATVRTAATAGAPGASEAVHAREG